MRMRWVALGVVLLAAAGQPPLHAQAAPSGQATAASPGRVVRVIGEVVAVDADSRLMTVKTDAGENFTLVFEENSAYLRVPPGEKTLDKAVPTTLAEIGRGDRVYARGEPLPDGKTLPTRQVVVMAKAAIEKKHEQEREEWVRRGILGTVAEVKPNTKDIVLQTRGGFQNPQSITVKTGPGVRFRRYAPDSVKFADAKLSSFAEIKAGDQLRALGQKGADGATYQAEQIVSGSFRTLGGTVTAVNAENNEIRITTFPDRRQIIVALNNDSTLRRFPKEFAAMMAQRMMGGGMGGMGGGMGRAPGAGGPGANGPPSGPPTLAGATSGQAPPGAPVSGALRTPPPGGAPPGAAPGAAAAAPPPGGAFAMRRAPGEPGMGPSRMAGGGGDAQDLLDRLPPLTLAELKPGDAVIVGSTAGKDPGRVTAIAIISGVEAFLALASAQPVQRAAPGVTLGLPGNALDIGMGLP